MVPSRNQLAPHCVSTQPVKSKYCHLTLKDLLSILVGITIPVAIGIYGAVTTDQAQKAARLAADEQQRAADLQRAFEIEQATQLYQQQLYKEFLDAMYVFHKDGELNDSASPWAFANARYRAVHREFDGARKVQALLFLKEKQLIGRRTCITGCEVRDVDDIIRLNGMSFDNVDLSSETGGLNALNLSCIQFDGISMVNSSFSQANMNGATFSNSRLNGSKFRGVSFNCARFENTEMGGVAFNRSNLSGAVFVKTDSLTTTLATTMSSKTSSSTLETTSRTTSTTTSETTSTTTSTTTSEAASRTTSTSTLETTSRTTSTTTSETTSTTRSTTTTTRAMLTIPLNATWSQTGVSIGGRFSKPQCLFVDDRLKILIADFGNHRIMQYNLNGTEGKVVAGGNGQGYEANQLNGPINVVVDHETSCLITCDHGNRRVVRWSRQINTTQGEILLENIPCFGIALDEQRNLYVSDTDKDEVRRYPLGDKNGTLVAGGNGKGAGLKQLQNPVYLFVDREQNVYVSDNGNHRVMKWNKDAVEGVVVAGGQGKGNALAQLAYPGGTFVDSYGTLYVVEHDNHRVTRWLRGAQTGSKTVGETSEGNGATQLKAPSGLSFDPYGNLYVADTENERVQRFSIQ